MSNKITLLSKNLRQLKPLNSSEGLAELSATWADASRLAERITSFAFLSLHDESLVFYTYRIMDVLLMVLSCSCI
jgi:hypothetical protein